MQNRISHITNQQGERMERHEDMEKELVDYFKDLQKEQQDNRQPAIDQITQLIPNLITDEHNQMLLRPITPQEVDTAMAQLKDGKAPGPDGFTANFFHHFWELIREEVWQLVEES